MNILILGSGGREHALAWKILQSPLCQQLYVAPGNAGTQEICKNTDIDILDFKSISEFISQNNIKIVVVGPEKPLVNGVYDYLKSRHPSLIVVGPSEKGAQLEGSKAFSKKFMDEFSIPTADYGEYSKSNMAEGIRHLQRMERPYVLKADGLAAGKGVLIIDNLDEAIFELNSMLSGKFGTASEVVVIEEFLSGLEFSVFVLTDGTGYALLPIAKDYKRIGEGDLGLNTGGMGAVSPVYFADEELMAKVKKRIIEPTLRGIQKRKLNYHGFIFFGLIMVKGEPYVIEYNCRMGDPESQVVIPRLDADLVKLFIALDEGKLSGQLVASKKESAVTVVCASGGYPEQYQKGFEIEGLTNVHRSIVFHAGTSHDAGKLITNGGRVLAVTSFGSDKDESVKVSLDSISQIHFKDMYYRKDIGFDLK